MKKPIIEFEGEHAEHYKKIAEECDIDLVVTRGLAAGKTAEDIARQVIGPDRWFFFRNNAMFRSFDKNHVEIYYTTGGTTVFPVSEQTWDLFNMLAIEQWDRYWVTKRAETAEQGLRETTAKLNQMLADLEEKRIDDAGDAFDRDRD